jgi:hypothetical protein
MSPQHTDFISFRHISCSRISESYGTSTFNFLMSLHTILCNDCANLYHCQHLLSYLFLITAIVTEMKCYLIVVLTCITLITGDIELFFHVLVGHLYVFFFKHQGNQTVSHPSPQLLKNMTLGYNSGPHCNGLPIAEVNSWPKTAASSFRRC